jgi:hypothetical protein
VKYVEYTALATSREIVDRDTERVVKTKVNTLGEGNLEDKVKLMMWLAMEYHTTSKAWFQHRSHGAPSVRCDVPLVPSGREGCNNMSLMSLPLFPSISIRRVCIELPLLLELKVHDCRFR